MRRSFLFPMAFAAAGLVALSLAGTAIAQAADGTAPEGSLREALTESMLKSARELLPAEASAALDALHRDWMKYRDSLCRIETETRLRPGRTPTGADGRDVDCLNRMNKSHQAEITRFIDLYVGRAERERTAQAQTAAKTAACRLEGLSEPFEVRAVTTYSGLVPVEATLGSSGRPAKQVDVVVTETAKPIVLALIGNSPIVWKVSYSPDAKIAGVIVSGFSRPALLGLPRSVPRLMAVSEDRTPCEAFLGLAKARIRIRDITGKEPQDVLSKPVKGRFVIGPEPAEGQSLISSSDYTLEEYTKPQLPQ